MFVRKPFYQYSGRNAHTPAAAGGAWTSVFTVTPNSPGDDAGYNGYTFVGSIPLAAFSATGGTQIRITFNGPTGAEDCTPAAFYVGNGGGADGYDFTGSPVQILSGGSGSFTMPKGSTLLSDAASFVKDGTNPFIYAAHFTSAAADNLWKNGGANPGSYATWFKNGAAEASTVNKTGYSDNTVAAWITMINKIELFI